jgi:hypothetical protein
LRREREKTPNNPVSEQARCEYALGAGDTSSIMGCDVRVVQRDRGRLLRNRPEISHVETALRCNSLPHTTRTKCYCGARDLGINGFDLMGTNTGNTERWFRWADTIELCGRDTVRRHEFLVLFKELTERWDAGEIELPYFLAYTSSLLYHTRDLQEDDFMGIVSLIQGSKFDDDVLQTK